MCTLEDCMLATSSIKARWSAYDGSSSERLMDVLTEMRKASIEPKRVVLFIVKLINRYDCSRGRKNGNQGLTIAPPFYIYNNQGDYTDEMKEVYYG